jgi:hypothetical protein
MSKIKVNIESRKFKDMPYPSLDYYYENSDGSVDLGAAEELSEKAQFLVLMHAMIEYYLCKFNGITEPEIAKWDLEIEELVKLGELSDETDPGYAVISDGEGAGIQAPYRDQHHLATAVEGLLLPSMQYSEAEYIKEMETLWMSQFTKESDGQVSQE